MSSGRTGTGGRASLPATVAAYLLAVAAGVCTAVLVWVCFLTDEEGNRPPVWWFVLTGVSLVTTVLGYRRLRAAVTGVGSWRSAGFLLAVAPAALALAFALPH